MNPDPETRCGACGHPRRLHAVTEPTARRVGCIACKANKLTTIGCGCPRVQSDYNFGGAPTPEGTPHA